jgi:Family of unknown function (DUF6463)
MAVSAIHFAFGLLVFPDHLQQLARAGWLGGVERDAMLGAVTWFMLFSPPLMVGGIAIHAIERQGAALPRALAWWLLGSGAVGVALMPASGFYLLLPPAIAIARRARRPHMSAKQSGAAT